MTSNPDAVKLAASACELLTAALPGRVTTPDSGPTYESLRDSYWSQTCWIPAAAYVQPKTTQEVAEALAIITRAGANFALRTRGHTPNPGFSGTDGSGIVIDLRLLDSLSVDKESGVIQAGAGSTWGDVYSLLESQGLSAIGGRDGTVGLAGFLLGGGYPAFPNLHGTGVDSVKNFEVVLADSTVVNANAESHSDLFRALKGGGSNFGIVTRFDIHVYPLIKTQITINLYDPSDYLNILKATTQVQEALEADAKLNVFANFNAGFVAVGLLYAGHPDEIPKEFDPFFNLKSLTTTAMPTTNGTILSLAKVMGHGQEPGRRTIGSVTTKVSHDLYVEVYKAWADVVSKLPQGVTLHYTIQPVSAAGVRAGKELGENVMGLDEVPQCWWVFTAEWTKASDDATMQQAINTMTQTVQTLGRDKGLLLDYLCMNFANSSQDVLRSYGAENVRSLQEAAAKYDPDGVFQKLQNGGYLLRDI